MRPTRFPVITLTAALTMLALSASSHAGSNHYRWTNERGIAVYSDKPPPQGVDYEVVSSSSSFKRVVDADEGAVPPEVEPSVGNEFEQAGTDAGKAIRKNPVICERARSNLEALTGSSRIQVKNDKGEVRDLSPEEIAVEKQTAKAQISVYCE